MTDEQKKYYNAMKKLGSKKPQKPIPRPSVTHSPDYALPVKDLDKLAHRRGFILFTISTIFELQ